MSRNRAYVSSVDALEAFRSDLIVYLSKARPALEEVAAEVMRFRVWLEDQQPAYWEKELRRRTRELQEAQNELFSARMSSLGKETAAQHFAVHRAKREVEEAVDKLRVIKRWNRDFDSRVQPLLKQMEKLQGYFSRDMVRAVAYLAEAVKTLSAYAERAPVSAAGAPAPPSAPAEATPPGPSGGGNQTKPT